MQPLKNRKNKNIQALVRQLEWGVSAQHVMPVHVKSVNFWQFLLKLCEILNRGVSDVVAERELWI